MHYKIPLLKQQKAAQTKRFMVIFLGLFFGFFVLILGLIINDVATPYLDSKNWVMTEATVVNSYVNSHSDDGTTMYSAYIEYSYPFNGKTHRSSKKSFLDSSSSSKSSYLSTVKNYPIGKNIFVYVNPKNPKQAVIDRELGLGVMIFIIPAVIIIVITFFVFRKRVFKKTAEISLPTTTYTKIIGIKTKKLKAIAVLLCISLVFGSVVLLILSKSSSFMDYLFLGGIFGGISLFLLVCAAVETLRYFSPTIELLILPEKPLIGASLRVQLNITGDRQKYSSVQAFLVGEESASYYRGTNRITENSLFYHKEIIRLIPQATSFPFTITVQLPKALPPTFLENSNRILWKIWVFGEIERWPDTEDTAEITILGSDKEELAHESER